MSNSKPAYQGEWGKAVDDLKEGKSCITIKNTTPDARDLGYVAGFWDLLRLNYELLYLEVNSQTGVLDASLVNYMTSALKENVTIKELALVGFLSGYPDALYRVIDALNENPYTRMQSLSIVNGDESDRKVFTALGSFVTSSKILKSLALVNCSLSDKSFAYLAGHWRRGTNLVLLSLKRNNLGDDTVDVLTGLLRDSRCIKKLRALDISFNKIKGFLLPQLLETTSAVESLDLSGNEIADSAAEAIVESLKQNTVLLDIRIGRFITEDCCIQLLESLRNNETLTSIDFGSSKDHTKFADAALKFVKQKANIIDIKLGGEPSIALAKEMKLNLFALKNKRQLLMALDLLHENVCFNSRYISIVDIRISRDKESNKIDVNDFNFNLVFPDWHRKTVYGGHPFVGELLNQTKSLLRTKSNSKRSSKPYLQSVRELASELLFEANGETTSIFKARSSSSSVQTTLSFYKFSNSFFLRSFLQLLMNPSFFFLVSFDLDIVLKANIPTDNEEKVVDEVFETLGFYCQDSPLFVVLKIDNKIEDLSLSTVQENIEKANTILANAAFQNKCYGIVKNDSDGCCFPSLKSMEIFSDGDSLSVDFRDSFVDFVETHLSASSKNNEISLRWPALLASLLEKNVKYVTVKELLSETDTFGVDDVFEFLTYYNNNGVFCWLQDQEIAKANINLEKSKVVLYPAWLSAELQKLCVEFEGVPVSAFVDNAEYELKREYTKTGVISSFLLKRLWGEHVEILLDICKFFELATDFGFSREKRSEKPVHRYFVPLMFPKASLLDDLESNTEDEFYISCGALLPQYVFSQIVCHFLRISSGNEGVSQPTVSLHRVKLELFPKVFCYLEYESRKELEVLLQPEVGKHIIKVSLCKNSGVSVGTFLSLLTDHHMLKNWAPRSSKHSLEIFLPRKKIDLLLLPYKITKAAFDEAKEEFTWNSSLVQTKDFEHFFSETIELDESESTKRYDCFLSHEWGETSANEVHQRVKYIKQELQKKGLVTWFDEDNMGKHIYKSMYNGMVKSDVCIVFLTKRYMERADSEGTSVEFEYSYIMKRRKTKVVYVFLEPGLNSFHLFDYYVNYMNGSGLYIDMTTTEKDQGNIEKLYQQIRRTQEGVVNIQ